MKAIWLGLCLLPLLGMAKDHPTAECSWLFKRIEVLEKAIKKGDELNTKEELARWKVEFRKKSCQQYDY
ncbi:hypothetical protein [Aeromonas sp. MR16]|uniref:hypothetical protein n=1 Tax=Aeromonas sp. MR16 TaxID=2923420 RepID=UPI001F4A8BCF|nr:hypothetical protein [Aeromonas sp. MR16]MCH7370438.1 hypothetical protein [Aeromonas sp. MR16]